MANSSLKSLEALALVSKVCAELDKHLGFSDKTLAEFIIHLVKDAKDHPSFHKNLHENGADFPEDLSLALLRLIQHETKPKAHVSASTQKMMHVPRSANEVAFPGLSGVNTGPVELKLDVRTEESEGDRKRQRSPTQDGKPPEKRKSRFQDAPLEHKASSSSSRNDARERDMYGGIVKTEPELYGIYDGKVANITDFGCFVELLGFPSNKGRKYEGLCHIAQIRKERITDIKSVVRKGQSCKVKVISLIGQKMSLSIKEVDQSTGEDLLPERSAEALKIAAQNMGSIAGKPSDGGPINFGVDVKKLREQEVDEERKAIRRQKNLSEAELWEARQLIASGVLSVTERPTFDAESGLGAIQDVEPDEDIDVEINEEEPPFLRGQTRGLKDVEPVRIVKNPDGSMQRAAVNQAELTKERRELKRAAQNDLMDAIPKDLSKPWNDPMVILRLLPDGDRLESISEVGFFPKPTFLKREYLKPNPRKSRVSIKNQSFKSPPSHFPIIFQ